MSIKERKINDNELIEYMNQMSTPKRVIAIDKIDEIKNYKDLFNDPNVVLIVREMIDYYRSKHEFKMVDNILFDRYSYDTKLSPDYDDVEDDEMDDTVKMSLKSDLEKREDYDYYKYGIVTTRRTFSLYNNKLIIPEGVHEISRGAFKNIDCITYIRLPSTLDTIKAFAFSGTGITRITIPHGVTSLHEECFSDCKQLKSVNLPKTLKAIGKYCFCNTSISYIRIPNEVTMIGEGCFNGCHNLVNIALSKGINTLEKRLFDDTGLKTFSIPDCITEIKWLCFANCSGLTRIEFPSSLDEIGDSCLENSNVIEIVIKDDMLNGFMPDLESRVYKMFNVNKTVTVMSTDEKNSRMRFIKTVNPDQ